MMAESVPPAMSWEQYEARLIQDWNRLLDSGAADREDAVHAFLEKHPCLLPGAYGFPQSGHFPVHCALISKPSLRAVGTHIPDFMWIAVSSTTLWPVLIEIEAPNKRWFTSHGFPTQKFTAATTQLAQWKSWFDIPANRQTFYDTFCTADEYRRNIHFKPQYVLVYGRRREFDENPPLRLLREPLQRDDEYYITFDRLHPLRDCANFICIRRGADAFEAVAVPPSLALGPSYAEPWHDIKRREEAIRSCEWMTAARKQFLISRLTHWDTWAASKHGLFNPLDSE